MSVVGISALCQSAFQVSGSVLMLGAVSPVLRAAAVVFAVAAVALGLWLLAGGRDFSEPPLDDRGENPPPPRSPLHAWRKSLSRPSRTAIGLSLVLLAYHGIAWTNPGFDMMQVPVHRWWAVLLGVFVAVWGSLAMDRNLK